jgi:molybdopterin converting factor small subunit
LVVRVHLHTTLQRQTPEGLIRRLEVTLSPISTLADLLSTLEINTDEEATLLVINGRTANPLQALKDGDEVHLIPAMSGG